MKRITWPGTLTVFLLISASLSGRDHEKCEYSDKSIDGILNVKAFNARGDSLTDDTGAIQAALNSAGQAGGKVYLPPGKYLISGSLNVPSGVSVTGSAEMPQYSDPLKGTIIIATCGRDNEEGPAVQNVISHSKSFLSLSDCYFSSDHKSVAPLVEADGGRLQIRGCSFAGKKPAIAIRKGVVHAIVSENNGSEGVRITNEIGNSAIIFNNEPEITQY